MKARSYALSFGVLAALAWWLTFIPQGVAQQPSECEVQCNLEADAAARVCRTLPPAQQGACLEDVAEALNECLAGCR